MVLSTVFDRNEVDQLETMRDVIAFLDRHNYERIENPSWGTHNGGFVLRLKNGYSLSVQYGSGNLCENYSVPRPEVGLGDKDFWEQSRNAEIAVYDAIEKWWAPEGEKPHDWVASYQTPQQIIGWIVAIERLKGNQLDSY